MENESFHSIVRTWCKRYRLMQDAPGNRRFYLTDSTASVLDLVQKTKDDMSPCVIMESDVDGYMKGGMIYRNYPVYFFVRAKKMADTDAAALAKEEAFMHAQNFLTWLRYMHENDPTRTRDYDRIDMESPIDIQTVGPIDNAWFGILVQLERQEQTDLCINEDLYSEGCDCDGQEGTD